MWKLVFLAFGIFNLAAILIPKKLNKIEIYATSFFAFTYGVTVDMILDLHYNLYGYFEEGFQWLGLIAIFMYFPSISVLFLNLYPLKSNKGGKIFYILAWTVFSLAFEWFCLHTKFYYQNGWKLWYSAIAYPIIFLILLINLRFVRRLINQI
ncbi:CBO0543 family protein [Bacillus sp. USDA818B3_A]|uniref:CBO0543 family protein n=1 Tax=Bacillus sp. USDA818B3_A TaxID=2698834 RepID=UPI00136C3DE0|nr:CBO0543 family protein [Bacillus sp. USDA818B3_A]